MLYKKQEGTRSWQYYKQTKSKISDLVVVTKMGRFMSVMVLPLVAVAVVSMCYGMADAVGAAPAGTPLQWHHYKVTNTCRYAEEYVRHQVKLFWDHDKSITAKLLRLVSTDCFVTVCVLLFGFYSKLYFILDVVLLTIII